MDSNEVRKYLKSKIESVTGWKASFTNAVDIKEIPYHTFQYKELLSEEFGRHVMELIVDTWDKDTPFDIIAKIDKLDAEFKCYKQLTDKFMIQIYHGPSREFIEDEDKTIKRLQRKYDMIVYERGE